MKTTPAPSAYSYPLLIRHLLNACRLASPQNEIISADLVRYTYTEFLERLGRLAGGLTALGVKPGDTVAVMNWDCHRYLECFFAIPMMGAILHTINIRLPAEQLLHTINHAEDDIILVHEDFLPLLNQIRTRIERPVRLAMIRDSAHYGRDTLPDGFDIEYETLLDMGKDGFEFIDFDEHRTATTFYTTGTTGNPKGVCYSHRQLVLHTMGVITALSPGDEHVRLHRGDVYMPMTPMFHVHGWGLPYAATMLGLKQVYPGRYDPVSLLSLISREGVTFSHCVPTILQMLLAADEVTPIDLNGLKVIVGGSALPHGLARAAVTKGVQLFAAYGMSETCPFLTVADTMGMNHGSVLDRDIAMRLKTGKPGALIEMRVVDPDMNDMPRGSGHTGEVVVRAPWLAQGYTGNIGDSEELWRGGYLHTGDVGYLDHDGSLQITDRMKDVIKSGGEWLSSIKLENIVSRCKGVGEVAVIAIPDEKWGERPMVIVTRSPDHAVTAQDIRNAVREQVDTGKLPGWAIPERVEFVTSIDKTSVGKLDKKLLRAHYAGPPGENPAEA